MRMAGWHLPSTSRGTPKLRLIPLPKRVIVEEPLLLIQQVASTSNSSRSLSAADSTTVSAHQHLRTRTSAKPRHVLSPPLHVSACHAALGAPGVASASASCFKLRRDTSSTPLAPAALLEAAREVLVESLRPSNDDFSMATTSKRP